MSDPSLFQDSAARPLADIMRPGSLGEFVGQSHILEVGKPLRDAILKGTVPSLILWGPPGSGKTTLALIVAKHTDQHFEPFSAVTEGVPRVREIIREAEERRKMEGRGTILFCDEIHRFNKAQQDAFLPWVERGVITLIGATTENPSFELTGALLSRCQVYVLEPLGRKDLGTVIERGLEYLGKGKGEKGKALLSDEALELLVTYADGDARRALNALETISQYFSLFPLPFSPDTVADLLSRRLPKYDKTGEEHFNLVSALHKSIRGSEPDAALYWLARMLEGGEDPLYIARRLVRVASEDVGLADPRALGVTVAARDAYHFLGSPEGELALAQAVVYLATAPKSNRVYEAFGHARHAAREHPAEPVPLHIRNAPTRLMKELNYGEGYRYDPAESEGHSRGQEYLPEALRGRRFYEPGERGYEKTVAERLRWWREKGVG